MHLFPRALFGVACLVLLLVGSRSVGNAQNSSQRDLVLAGGERRLALVVGNNAYPKAPLGNAVFDATSVSAALREVGFDVTTVTDADLPTFERVVDAFALRLQRTDIAVFFFAGHGVQVDGDNYLVPIDFNGVDEADAKARTYSATRLQEKIEARARIRVMILDACRNNPFKSSRSGQGGLSAMQGRGSLIAFATAAGSTANDNPRGKNGLFTEHLLEVLRQPGLSSREVFFKVRARVNAASAGKQFPWVSDGLIGDFVFRAGAADPAAAGPVSVSRPADVAPAPRASRMPTPAPGGPRQVISRALTGDAGAANGVSVSPGSMWLAAGYETGVVKLWDPRSGKAVALLTGHIGSVSAVAFSPDGRHLAATSGDRTVRVWDFDQQVESGRLVGHTEAVSAIAFSPDGRTIATAAADMTTRLWNADTGDSGEVFSGHRDWVTSLAFSADGRSLVSGGRDRSVRVWDVARARERMTLETPSGVWSIAVTRDLGLIAAGTDEGTVVVWDGDSGQVKWTGQAHKGAVWALAFSGDGALLASGGADALVKTWDTASFKAVQTFRGHAAWVRGVAFDPSNEWLASAGGDGDVRTWRVSVAKF
jgi:hypothetical protein